MRASGGKASRPEASAAGRRHQEQSSGAWDGSGGALGAALRFGLPGVGQEGATQGAGTESDHTVMLLVGAGHRPEGCYRVKVVSLTRAAWVRMPTAER